MTYLLRCSRGISDVLERTRFALSMAQGNECSLLYDTRAITGPSNDYSDLFSLNSELINDNPESIDEFAPSSTELVLDIQERMKTPRRYRIRPGIFYRKIVEFSPYLIQRSNDLTKDWKANVYGVSARLGNGETLDRKKVKRTGRRFPQANQFFMQMDRILKNHPETIFFVCSDSQKFVNECVERYNALKQDIVLLPEGCGAHPMGLTNDTRQDNDTREFIKSNGTAVTFYADALVDMLTLVRCKRILCSRWSGLTTYAKIHGSTIFHIERMRKR